MKIKSYYSRTVEEAIASARADLGPEAMLVNSRKAPIQSRHLGEYEVVFASLTPGEEEAAAPVPGFIGFAVGRTTFWDPLVGLRDGKMSREQAVRAIADRYLEWIGAFEAARAG